MVRSSTAWLLAVAILLGAASLATAQSIVLDRPVRAGELTLFPSVSEPDEFYYATDKVRLATHANGSPQFSFLRWVENVRSDGPEEAREGEGGGIVHAVVELGVTDEQLDDARRALRSQRSGAEIVGPALFRSGRFGLVSAFADDEGGLSHRVLGLGNAPILEGGKAAVSIQLTKQGAKVLWESFHGETPDISFSFDMQLDGYRSPVRATLEADFEKIYSHSDFQAAAAAQTGKVFLAAEIQNSFDDLRRSGAIRLTQIGEDAALEGLIQTAYGKIMELMFEPVSPQTLMQTGEDGRSLLDRTTEALRQAREEARQENARIREHNLKLREAARQRAEVLQAQTQDLDSVLGQLASEAPELASRIERHKAFLAELRQHAQEGASLGDAAAPAIAEVDEEPVPEFAAMAAFEMRRSRQTVALHIDLNKYTTDSRSVRFDENIGSLTQHLDNAQIFRSVNLDDPLFKQRELTAFVDGANADDFREYINFVNVQLRKRHESGEETLDEVRIDRENFSDSGNRFRLMYGWKGDDDRRRWLDYEYRTHWSFFGGHDLEEPWTRSSFGAIALTPPYQRRRVDIEADPDVLREAGVRAILVKLFYDLEGSEQSEERRLYPSRDEFSSSVDLLLPGGETRYDYEVLWMRRGKPELSSGRRSSTSSILFVDELPEGS